MNRTRKDLLLDDPDAFGRIWEDPTGFTNKTPLLSLLTGHGAHIEDVGRRLKLDIITWHDFMRVLREARDQAIATGDETLDNLCHGIIEQILATPDCEVSASGNIGPAKHVPLTLT